MRKIILFLLVFFLAEVHAQQITTFILVRHAEKVSDGSKDPELTEEGKQRAKRFADLLKETKVDAIYSTNYKRTMNTIGPVSEAKGIKLRLYEPLKAEPINDMLNSFPGGTIVVCGHSNTTPWIANYLIGSETYKNFDDADYGNVLIVEVTEKGKGKVVWLKY